MNRTQIRRRRTALELLARGPVKQDDPSLRFTIGASPRLTLGALCREGLARFDHATDSYVAETK
jgi:hypothetical protein